MPLGQHPHYPQLIGPGLGDIMREVRGHLTNRGWGTLWDYERGEGATDCGGEGDYHLTASHHFIVYS